MESKGEQGRAKEFNVEQGRARENKGEEQREWE